LLLAPQNVSNQYAGKSLRWDSSTVVQLFTVWELEKNKWSVQIFYCWCASHRLCKLRANKIRANS